MKLLIVSLLTLSFFTSYSQVVDLGKVSRPVSNAPTLSPSPTSLTGFSTAVSVASSPQTFALSGTNLTGNASLTAPAGFEMSLNGSSYAGTQSISESGGSLVSQPVTVYVRLASSSSAGTFSGNVSITSPGTAANVAVSGTVNTVVPTISTSTNTLTGFSTNSGTASASQNYTLTGTYLTASIIVTPPSGYELSTDNSTFSSSLTVTESGGNASAVVYTRLAAADGSGSYTGNITHVSTGATQQNVALSGTVSASAATAKWNFSNTSQIVSGWNNMFGNPAAGLTVTDPGTGWVLTTNPTLWCNLGGFFWSANTGGGSSSGGSYGTDFPSTVVAGIFYNGGSGSSCYFASAGGIYPFTITGLPAGTYQIKILPSWSSTSDASSNNGICELHYKFGTGSDIPDLTVNQQNNTQTESVQSGTITAGQSIQFGPFRNVNTGGYSVINAIIITKTN